MKDQFKLIFFSLIIIITFVLSCKRETIYEGPKGEIKGNMALYSQDSKLTDYSGILVSVEGSSPHLQTITNTAGDWAINNLTTGIYNIVFSKDSFATFKAMNFQYIGGKVPLYLSPGPLYKLPYNVITHFSIDSLGYSWGSNVVINLTFQAISPPYFRFYISEDSTVSNSNYQANFIYYVSYAPTFNMPGNIISKFKAGNKMYAICYPSTESRNSYTDMITGNEIYGINSALASQVIQFTIPTHLK